VLIVKNPRNLEIHPTPGKRLPSDWQHQAAARAAEANRNYTSAIENAWRQPLGRQNIPTPVEMLASPATAMAAATAWTAPCD
jgi:hypothetical protein